MLKNKTNHMPNNKKVCNRHISDNNQFNLMTNKCFGERKSNNYINNQIDEYSSYDCKNQSINNIEQNRLELNEYLTEFPSLDESMKKSTPSINNYIYRTPITTNVPCKFGENCYNPICSYMHVKESCLALNCDCPLRHIMKKIQDMIEIEESRYKLRIKKLNDARNYANLQIR